MLWTAHPDMLWCVRVTARRLSGVALVVEWMIVGCQGYGRGDAQTQSLFGLSFIAERGRRRRPISAPPRTIRA